MIVRACFAAIAMLALGLAQAQEGVGLPCAPSDKVCARKAVRNHAVRRFDIWKADLARPLDARIGGAPAALVEYLTLVFVWGAVTHVDLFGKSQKTQFRLFCSGKSGREGVLSICPDGNSAT